METRILSTQKFDVENLNDIPRLLGARDKFMRLLENTMNVSINLRGTVLEVSSKNSQDIKLTISVIKELLNLIHHGIKITGYDVVSAVKMAQNNTLDNFSQLYNQVLLRDDKGHEIRVKNFGQRKYVQAIHNHTITFGIGPAGTGKTYLAVVLAVRALRAGKVDKIVITRPAVEAGESLGFLPGDLKDKIDPYLRPIYDALFEIIGADHTKRLLDQDVIEIAPLAYMRGRTLSSSFVILDEAQNATNMQMKMFLTRLGFNSKMVVDGDASQIDLKRNHDSGLLQAPKILKHIKGIAFVHFTSQDVVRNPVVSRIVKAYAKHNK